uniref:putative histone-lysine N-methyltransferase PRDM6 n=1 Tax=Arvicanthis niloticus TaxID=61156 RepID=UPI001486C15A|nr:putative histone-lysine N-methyltransferase PRDM6 [Arvicanthis niloticus]
MQTPPASLGRLWRTRGSPAAGCHSTGTLRGAPRRPFPWEMRAATWHLQFSGTGSRPRLRPHQPWLRAPGRAGSGARWSPATAATYAAAAAAAAAASLGALVTATRDVLGAPVAAPPVAAPAAATAKKPEALRGPRCWCREPSGRSPCSAAEAGARGRPRRGASLRRTVREEGSPA